MALVVAALLAGRLQLPLREPPEGFARVLRVHDGDTVSIRYRGRTERVRLLGIDAPELGQRPWGPRAKKHLRRLLGQAGWLVRLELDVQGRDRYGRLLAYLRSPQGLMINLQMVRDGYALVYTRPPNVRYSAELLQAQREAQVAGAGFWSKGGLQESPRRYRERHPRL